MVNIIVIAILIVAMLIALQGSIKHFKGQGGCCGGGSTVKARKKKLKGPVLGTFVMEIEGMHCENCKNRIEGKLNDIEGVACRVNLKKKTATVSFSRDITKEEIRSIIEKYGYTVLGIRQV